MICVPLYTGPRIFVQCRSKFESVSGADGVHNEVTECI